MCMNSFMSRVFYEGNISFPSRQLFTVAKKIIQIFFQAVNLKITRCVVTRNGICSLVSDFTIRTEFFMKT